MKYLALLVLLSVWLTGCTTTSSDGEASNFGVPDEKGFVLRPDAALFHLGTGLHCPTAINDIPRSGWTEYRNDIDAGCSYKGAGRILTLYVYQSDQTLREEVGQAVSAVMQAPQNPTYELSESQTEMCQEIGNSYNMQGQLLSGLAGLIAGSNEAPNEITVNTDPDAGPLPYMAAALVGDTMRSYVAVGESDIWTVKVRYSVVKENEDEETLISECETLHAVTKDLAMSRGNADGIYEEPAWTALLGDENDS